MIDPYISKQVQLCGILHHVMDNLYEGENLMEVYGIVYNLHEGFSSINGITYPAYFKFKTEEDLLAFILKFPGVLKFPNGVDDRAVYTYG